MTTELTADCSRCAGLCCVAPAFARSSDFAIDKPAGRPCPNLLADHRCGIHDTLRSRGFAGCTVFDCLGAGQRLTEQTFGGRGWRDHPTAARAMFAAFDVMRGLQELLHHLDHAVRICTDDAVSSALRQTFDEIDDIADKSPERLLQVDVPALRGRANPLLSRCSQLIRDAAPWPHADLRGADLVGRDLRRRDLRAANLRGTLLVGADLTEMDLALADLTGADLRGANLSGANLTESLFLLQSQLDSARGDRSTRVPATLRRPDHWA